MPVKNAQERTAVSPSNLHVPEDCRAVSDVLDQLGDKWSVLVVVMLGDRPKRFNELRRSIATAHAHADVASIGARRTGHAHHVSNHPAARGV